MPGWLSTVLMAIVSIAIQVGFHLYVWRRLVRDTGLSRKVKRGATIGLCVLGVSIPATFWAGRMGAVWVGQTVGWVSFLWMALIAMMVVGLALVDLVRLAIRIGKRVLKQPAMDPGRREALARIGGGVVVAAAAGTVVAGVREALGEHRVNDIEAEMPGMGAELDGFTIVQITDLHAGNTIGRGYVADVVERVNALRPDLIAVTGDAVDGPVDRLRDVVAPLRALSAPHGVWFVTGNHEYYSGADAWLAELGTMGLRALRNQRVAIQRGAARFELAGVDDRSASQFGRGHGADYQRALGGREPGVPCVLLAHQPRQVHAAARHGVEVQLSGHTHGGQIWPWHHIVSLQQGGLVAGWYRVGGTRVHVSRGCGYWGPPVRVLAPAEITRLTLRHAPRTA